MFTLPSQPQTIGETLDTGFKLYFKSFKSIFFISLIMNCLWLINGLVFGPEIIKSEMQPNDVVKIFALIFSILLVYLIFQVAIIHRINNFANNNSVSTNESFQLGFKLFFPMVLATILNSLILMVGFILLIIPGIALAIYLMLFPIAMVTESTGPLDSLQRSMDLVKQNWWRSMLIVTVVMIVYSILYSVVGLGFGITVAINPPEDINDYAFIFDMVGAIIGTILAPLAFSMLIALFNDLKIRREGGDLEARLDEMD